MHSKCYFPSSCSLRLKSRAALVERQPLRLALDVTLDRPSRGGYAGVRVGEAQKTGPTAHERDPAEERSARRKRSNEARDVVPGSQDSTTRGVRNLQLTDSPATQTTRRAPSPPVPTSRRATQPRSRQQRHCLRSAQCGSDPDVFTGNKDHGLMMHMGQKHGGSAADSRKCAQLRQLDRAACVSCGTIRSRRCSRCNRSKRDTATRDITVWVTSSKIDDSSVIRMQPPARPTLTNLLTVRSQCRPESFGCQSTSELPHWDIVVTIGNSSPTSAEPRPWRSRVALSPGVPPRGQRAVREPVATNLGPFCVDIGAACCLRRFRRVLTETRD